jgi:glycosyltransferase involved in cell wall biosynthesis
LIKKACKEEKIDFLIINNIFIPNLIKWYKSLGVKVIGLFHGVFISPMFNNSTKSYRSWKNLEFLDAFIHISPDDYYYYNNFGFKRNIFIPNLYTFEPSETPSSNLTNHNIMMLGRLNDKKKGLIYALKAMVLIIKEIPDAKLYLVSSDGKNQELINTINQYKLRNNVIFVSFTPNVTKYFLDSSVFFFTSLTEAFPMALNEAKAYGLPCVTFDVSYSVPYQSGVIKVEHFDYKGLAREVVKLLKDYEYRIKMGKEAKLSLNKFTNEGTTELWGRLFSSLKRGEDEFQKFRKEIMDKYYNKEIAEKHMEKQFKYLKMYNKFFRCHSIKNFTNLSYINNIQDCQNVSRRY